MYNSLADIGNGESRQEEKQVTSAQTYTHIHNTRPLRKTDPLRLAMEGTNKERNRLPLVKHITQ